MEKQDISNNALRLARAADRAFRVPGQYTITVDVNPHTRAWHYTVSRVERVEVAVARGNKNGANS